jgi:hypothetical protein
LKLSSEKNINGIKVVYTAMTIFHIYLKSINEQKYKNNKFDIKLLLLACLRISAVLSDIELS